MASITYTPNVTVIPSTWLNDVNTVAYTIFGDGSSYTGNITINTNKFTVAYSSGNTIIAGTLGLSGALTYGGVTLNNAVTGTGNMVLSVSPTFTGTANFAAIAATGDIQQNNAAYLRGKTLAGTSTRILGMNGADTLYIGSVDTAMSGGIIFYNNGNTGMTISAAGAVAVPGTLGVTNLLTASSGIAVTKATGNSATFTDGSTYTLAASSGGASSAAFGGTAGTLSLILQVNGATAQTLTTTGTTFPGTLGVTGDITASSGVVNLGAGNGFVQTATNGVAEIAFNYVGYAGGTTQFRNFGVYDGKNAPIFSIVGSTKAVSLTGTLDVSDAITNTKSTNATFGPVVTNANAGTAAQARFVASNGTSTTVLGMLGTGFTTAGQFIAGRGYLLNTGTSMVYSVGAGSHIFSGDAGTTAHFTVSSSGASVTGTLGVASGGTTGIGIGTAPVAGNLLLLSGSPLSTAHLKFIDTQASGRTWQIGPGQGTATVTEFNIYDTTGAAVLAQFKTTGTRLAGALQNVGAITGMSDTAIPAGGTAGSGLLVSSTANFGVFFGSGAPTLSAAKGSLYLRSDGSATNNRMYVNTDGGTTWTAVTTAA